MLSGIKTDYFGHDALYKRFKAEGKRGWSPDEEVQITLTQLEEFLRAEYTPKKGKLLELGCGDGTFSLWFAEKGFDVYGIDISPTAIDWAKEKATTQKSSTHFRVGSVLNLKNYTNNFLTLFLTVTVSTASLEMIEDSFWKAC
jgi:2-polyprenyl-3-methyl-5-hydroxy-6-metoxy-1,4-benzoquinol methylase